MKKEINILMVKNAKDCEYLHIYNTDKLMDTVRPSGDKWVKAKIVYDEPRKKMLSEDEVRDALNDAYYRTGDGEELSFYDYAIEKLFGEEE